jgi:hypothetical protein
LAVFEGPRLRICGYRSSCWGSHGGVCSLTKNGSSTILDVAKHGRVRSERLKPAITSNRAGAVEAHQYGAFSSTLSDGLTFRQSSESRRKERKRLIAQTLDRPYGLAPGDLRRRLTGVGLRNLHSDADGTPARRQRLSIDTRSGRRSRLPRGAAPSSDHPSSTDGRPRSGHWKSEMLFIPAPFSVELLLLRVISRRREIPPTGDERPRCISRGCNLHHCWSTAF